MCARERSRGLSGPAILAVVETWAWTGLSLRLYGVSVELDSKLHNHYYGSTLSYSSGMPGRKLIMILAEIVFLSTRCYKQGTWASRVRRISVASTTTFSHTAVAKVSTRGTVLQLEVHIRAHGRGPFWVVMD